MSSIDTIFLNAPYHDTRSTNNALIDLKKIINFFMSNPQHEDNSLLISTLEDMKIFDYPLDNINDFINTSHPDLHMQLSDLQYSPFLVSLLTLLISHPNTKFITFFLDYLQKHYSDEFKYPGMSYSKRALAIGLTSPQSSLYDKFSSKFTYDTNLGSLINKMLHGDARILHEYKTDAKDLSEIKDPYITINDTIFDISKRNTNHFKKSITSYLLHIQTYDTTIYVLLATRPKNVIAIFFDDAKSYTTEILIPLNFQYTPNQLDNYALEKLIYDFVHKNLIYT